MISPSPLHTKIIATIGPTVGTYEKIRELIEAGVDVARLNFSHGTHPEHAEKIAILKRVRKELGRPLAIMLDTKGPEIRLGKIKEGALTLHPKQHWRLVPEEVEGDAERISLRPGFVLNQLKVGMHVLFADGYIAGHIISIDHSGVVVEIDNGGIINSGKNVSFPYVAIDIPSVSDKDIADIKFGCEQDVDYIAASFVRCADDVLEIKKILASYNRTDILVIAKIENHEGVENFDEIVHVADGIMVARGDLGVAVPLTHVPRLQKMMIRKSYLAGKPSVTATQMLESMITNPRPTRAEASDVANAIYDSTSAVMLSGETAVGKYPIETVKIMRSIAAEAESDFDYRTFFNTHSPLLFHDVTSAVTLATVKTAYSFNVKAIFVFTTGGSTARLLARLRPPMPILAMTSNEKCYQQMALNWGIVPILAEPSKDLVEAFSKLSQYALEKGYVKDEDIVVLTAGSPFGICGTTNMMIVETIHKAL